MSENFGLKIGLEGEREFKKSLAEINNSFKVLGSEMKLVDSQFDKNDKSTEALTARSEVLNKEIDSQKQKIETLRSALANAAESFSENDRRTQSWQIQLNNAQAALNGMERELNSNNAALEKADKGFDEAGDEARTLTGN
jgi:phage-related minor tail protein